MIETGFRLKCTVNGTEMERTVAPLTRVLDFLRSDLMLTGVKPGCEAGRCGSCMVLVDGEPMNSCLLMAYQIDGQAVTTPEGIGAEQLHPIQTALLEEGGLQCGYCTPGMAVSLKGLFDREAAPTREEIVEALSGNLCRCTGYEGILRAAVRLASQSKAD